MPKRPSTKDALHPRSRHRGSYDFPALIACTPALKAFVRKSPAGTDTIDFASPDAVRTLNQALLHHHYGVQQWNLPEGYLCPPIPGRADYIHHLADLLADGKEIPRGPEVRVLDIGTGANLIYPLIGTVEYGWSFVGTEIDADALRAARRIVEANPAIGSHMDLRMQWSAMQSLRGVIKPRETFHLTMCNPPFYLSMKHANEGTRRKALNLTGNAAAQRNVLGQPQELCCAGGEAGFIIRLIHESATYPAVSLWFTSLVSKSDHLDVLKRELRSVGATKCKIISMAQGQKQTRFIAWSFL